MYCHTNVWVWKKLITTAGCCCSQKCRWFFCFQSFFESHHAPAAERTVQQCCENILLNAAWLKRDADDIHQYLLQRKAPPVWPPNSDPSLTCSLTPKWASSGYLLRKQKWFQNCNSILRITQESIKRSETRKQDCSLLSVPHSASGRRKCTRAELWLKRKRFSMLFYELVLHVHTSFPQYGTPLMQWYYNAIISLSSHSPVEKKKNKHDVEMLNFKFVCLFVCVFFCSVQMTISSFSFISNGYIFTQYIYPESSAAWLGRMEVKGWDALVTERTLW